MLHSKRYRLITAVMLGIGLYSWKLYSAWSELGEVPWYFFLLALIWPVIYGVGWYWMTGIERKPRTPFFKRRTEKESVKQRSQDWAFEQAVQEIEDNTLDKAVWARALTDSDGDDAKTKATYIKRRVSRLLEDRAKETAAIHIESEESKRSRSRYRKLMWGVLSVSALAFAGGLIFLVVDAKYFAKKPQEHGQASIDLAPPTEASSEKSWTPPADALEPPSSNGPPPKKVKSYIGVELGGTMDSVITKLGLPSDVSTITSDKSDPRYQRQLKFMPNMDGEQFFTATPEEIRDSRGGVKDFYRWDYWGAGSPSVAVSFNKARRVRGISCSSLTSVSDDRWIEIKDVCTLNGVALRATQDEVIRRLGRPTAGGDGSFWDYKNLNMHLMFGSGNNGVLSIYAGDDDPYPPKGPR